MGAFRTLDFLGLTHASHLSKFARLPTRTWELSQVACQRTHLPEIRRNPSDDGVRLSSVLTDTVNQRFQSVCFG